MPSRRLVLFGCLIAVALAVGTLRSNPPAALPHADPLPCRSEAGVRAGQRFWEAFHGNDYGKLDAVLADLTAAYQQTPDDAQLTALLAAAHGWKFLERRRACRTACDLRDHLAASAALFDRAACQNPANRLYPGFAEGFKATLGLLDGNRPQLDAAVATLRRNVKADPTVHGFVQGWVLTALFDHTDPRFAEAMAGHFAAVDHCAGFRLPRLFPYVPRLAMLLLAFRGRSDVMCYNTEVAPHNLEATLLAMGDGYLKEGKLCQARLLYKSVKNCSNYATWPFKDRLKPRLENPEWLRDKFRADSGKLDVAEPAMFFQSSFACTGCHAR